MLRVVQTAAWDWAPPHMSRYPHLLASPPQYQRSYHEDPQWPGYPPQPRGPPPPPPHGEPPRGHPPPLPYGAPPRGHAPSLPYGAPLRGPPPSLPYGAPTSATGEPPELHPKALLGPFTDVAESKKVRGRLRNQPDRTSSVAAFNAWFVRSRESHVFLCLPRAERNRRFLFVKNESIKFCCSGGFSNVPDVMEASVFFCSFPPFSM